MIKWEDLAYNETIIGQAELNRLIDLRNYYENAIKDNEESAESYRRSMVDYNKRIEGEKKIIEFAKKEGIHSQTMFRLENILISSKNDSQMAIRNRNICLTNVKTLTQKLEGTNKQIDTLKNRDKSWYQKIADNINMIETIKKVGNVTLTDQNVLHVKTKELYITEPVTGKRFYLGSMLIKINLASTDPNTIKTENINNCRNGYTDACQHPHIFGNEDACWGNTTDILLEYLQQHNYYLVIINIIQFLETCNIFDAAGRYVSAWDEVDEGGHIIHYGDDYIWLDAEGDYHAAEGEFFCEFCEEYRDDEDRCTCEDCDETVCDRCVYALEMWDGNTKYVCPDCYERYTRCEECGCYVHDNDICFVSHATEICPVCLDENYIRNADGTYTRRGH